MAIADPAHQPAYIHCGSANRVGAMWFIKRVQQDGWDTQRAMAEAETIGLRSEGLKAPANPAVRPTSRCSPFGTSPSSIATACTTRPASTGGGCRIPPSS